MKALMLAALDFFQRIHAEKTLTESTTQRTSNIKDGYIPKQDKTSTSQKLNILPKMAMYPCLKPGSPFSRPIILTFSNR